MNWFDFIILFGSILGIALYGIWHTRHRADLDTYVKGKVGTPWFAIALSVMTTQASAITFLSTPGQGYLSGLSFVQIYFGVPTAMLIIAMVFLPIFHKLKVYTAYEFLEKRFDTKTRLLGATLFLVQRGLGAGLTIYAPAIVVSAVFGWPLDVTIIACGLVATAYTVFGGSEAVTVTQKYQAAIIFAGMIAATYLLIQKLPTALSFSDALTLAGGFGKLNAVNFSTSIHERYTFWSGILGGTFLMLSYFGTDQSQVQRYISGSSLRESRLALLFNAVTKIPMQFCILFIGVLLFVFYQFHQSPLLFDSASSHYLAQHQSDPQLQGFQNAFQAKHTELGQQLETWLSAKHKGDEASAKTALTQAMSAQREVEQIRALANKDVMTKSNNVRANDADYVFITFIINELPHGVIGLLIAAFFAATLSSKSAELNALGTCTSIDFYRLFNRKTSDERCLAAAKWFTGIWGLGAIGVALCLRLAENLIQAVNILGSIFYGVVLGLFLVAFFIKRVGGTAVFWAAVIAQVLVFFLYFNLTISYLWYPLIGCAACIAFSIILQTVLGRNRNTAEEYAS